MLRHRNHVLIAADGTPHRPRYHHCHDTAQHTYHNDPAQLHIQHGSHQHRSRRRRDKRMAHCQSCQKRDRIKKGRTFRPFRQRECQRDQNDQSGVEKYRHGDDQTCNTQRPGRFLIAEPPDHTDRQCLRSSRGLQDRSEHGSQPYQQRNSF